MPETRSRTVTRVGRVIVTVADQDRAVEFYTEKLGFEKRADIPYNGGAHRWIEVAPPGGQTSISLCLPMEGDTAGKHTGVVLDTDEVQAAHAALQAAGVDVDAELMSGPDIPSMFWFRDVDGNTLLVVETPGS